MITFLYINCVFHGRDFLSYFINFLTLFTSGNVKILLVGGASSAELGLEVSGQINCFIFTQLCIIVIGIIWMSFPPFVLHDICVKNLSNIN